MDAPFPARFEQRLNERCSLRRGELLRFDVVRYRGDAATDLAMTWQHLLFDGSGSEHFVRWLDACWRGEQRVDTLPDPDELASPSAPERSASERGRAARSWQSWLESLATRPMRSLAGPRRRTPQALRWDAQYRRPPLSFCFCPGL